MVYKYLKLFLCAFASISAAPLSFISYGDWGSSNYNQEMISKTLGKLQKKLEEMQVS